MIYGLLFYEFFKIGLFAIGGGLVTVPFLFDLAANYPWFDTKMLADMIAISESTPGPLGVNMATFAGFKAAGIGGSLAATIGLVMPSVIIVVIIAKLLNKFACNRNVQNILYGIRPAVLALIVFAGWQIARIAVTDYLSLGLFVVFWLLIHFWKQSPIFYMIAAAGVGIILKL